VSTNPKNPPPAASVVLCVLNGEECLPRALDSIFAQTFADFEAIVVDDGSTDATAEILAGYAAREPRLRVLRHARNEGIPKSLNDGIAAARAPLILRADADDYNFPGRFALQVAFMREHPEVDVLGGAMERADSRGRVFSVTSQPATNAGIQRRLYLRVPFFHPTVALRKAFWERHGGYSTRWPHCEDADLWLRAHKGATYANLPDILVRYHAPRTLRHSRQLEVFRMLLANGKRNGELHRALLAIAKFTAATFWFKVFPSKYFAP
jgi:glycosyltransferase involved in cell wall biosynthesis